MTEALRLPKASVVRRAAASGLETGLLLGLLVLCSGLAPLTMFLTEIFGVLLAIYGGAKDIDGGAVPQQAADRHPRGGPRDRRGPICGSTRGAEQLLPRAVPALRDSHGRVGQSRAGRWRDASGPARDGCDSGQPTHRRLHRQYPGRAGQGELTATIRLRWFARAVGHAGRPSNPGRQGGVRASQRAGTPPAHQPPTAYPKRTIRSRAGAVTAAAASAGSSR